MFSTPTLPKPALASLKAPQQALLRWFDTWIQQGSMESITHEGLTYFWVLHSKVFCDLFPQFTSERQIKRALSTLSGSVRKQVNRTDTFVFSQESPLQRFETYTRQGHRSWYRFRTEVPMTKLIEAEAPAFTRNEKPQKHRLTEPIAEILEWCLSLPKKGSADLVFTNQWSRDREIYTATIRQASDFIHQVHEGTFTRGKTLTPWFSKMYGVNVDEVREALLKAKGSWPETFTLVKTSVRNFRFAYDMNRLPMDKEKLPRSLTDFLWNETSHGGTSQFLGCLLNKPDNVTEPVADLIYDTLPAEVQEVGQTLLDDHDWDTLEFWNRVKQVHTWGLMFYHANPIAGGVQYWFEGGVARWFKSYLDDLVEMTGGPPQLKNLGTDNATWNWYLRQAAQRHEIDFRIIA